MEESTNPELLAEIDAAVAEARAVWQAQHAHDTPDDTAEAPPDTADWAPPAAADPFPTDPFGGPVSSRLRGRASRVMHVSSAPTYAPVGWLSLLRGCAFFLELVRY